MLEGKELPRDEHEQTIRSQKYVISMAGKGSSGNVNVTQYVPDKKLNPK